MISAQGVRPAGRPFTRYHSFDGTHIDIDAGFPLASAITGSGRAVAGELPGGDVISTVHIGSYESIMDAGAALDAWLAAHGRLAAGPNWEIYWIAPGDSPNPSDWKTEVVKPLR